MPSDSIAIILAELQQFRASVEARFDKQDEELDKASEQIAKLSANMKELLGNGQPGRIQRIEQDCHSCKSSVGCRLAKLEENKALWMGKHSIVAASVATIISVMIALHDHVANAIKTILK